METVDNLSEAEDKLRAYIEKRKKDGDCSKEELASLELQLGLTTSWVLWVKKYRDDPSLVLEAAAIVFGHHIAEVFFNLIKPIASMDEDGGEEFINSGIESIGPFISEVAKEVYDSVVKGKGPVGVAVNFKKSRLQ